MLSIIYQYCIQNEKKAGKRSAEQCVWHPPCSSESLLQSVQGRTSLSVCTVISHSNMQAVLKRRGISFMAWAPDHTEKDHIQFIQGTLLDKNVQLRHIYIYIYICIYTSAKVCKNPWVLCHGFVLTCGSNLLCTFYIDFAAPTQWNFQVFPMS